MRVLVLGEGRHDIGRRDPKTGDMDKQALGWATCLVKSMLKGSDPVDLVADSYKWMPALPKPRKYASAPEGVQAHLSRALRYADGHLNKGEVLVFVTDADTSEKSEWQDKCGKAKEYSEKKQREYDVVIAIPKSVSESWLLADADAWRGVGLCDIGKLPTRPEDAWGKDGDLAGNHPKHVFNRLSDEARNLRGSGTERRQDIAGMSDPTKIIEKCPLSFRPFWQALHDVGLAEAPPVERMRRR